jgi:group I intron endonuclease
MSNLIKNKKYHFIYKTTNLINGKYYVGMHSTSNLKDRYLGSGKKLKYSIAKYGKENFNFEILEFFDNREELIKREEELVNIDLLNDSNCLNLQKGGKSSFDSLHAKRKIDVEYDKNWKTIQGQKLKLAHKAGKIKIPDWTGKKHSEETKKKIGQANSIKQNGEGNSQYGTCWITKEGQNKKIKKEEFETYFNNGWVKGRYISNLI